MSFKIMNEDFEVGQKFKGLVNGKILTVVDIRVPGVEYPSRAPSGGFYMDRVEQKTVYFKDEQGKVSKTGYETAKRLLLERIDETKKSLDEKLSDAAVRSVNNEIRKDVKESIVKE